MSQSWFYLVGEKPIGPVSLEELQAAFAAGLLKRDARVREGMLGQWHLAAQVLGRAGTPPATDGVVAPPFAGLARLPLVAPGVPPVATMAAPPVATLPPPPIATLAAPPVATLAAPPVVVHTSSAEATSVADESTSFPVRAAVIVLSGLLTGLLLMVAASMAMRSPRAGHAPGGKDQGRASAATAGAAVEAAAKSSAGKLAASSAAAPAKAMAAGIVLARNDLPHAASSAPPRADQNPYEGQVEPTVKNKIDELVFAQLKKLGIEPAKICSDQVFVRRAFLDVIGTLPTPEEAQAFLKDRDPNKRGVLIDRLLERREFADYWSMRWCDVLRVKAEFPINLWPNAAQAYHRWIHTAVRENMPYDQFARALLTTSGSNFRVPQVNFYRAVQSKDPPALAQAVALTFMGTRTDKWPKAKLQGLAAFFAQIAYKATGEWKEEIVMHDPGKAPLPASAAVAPVFPDGVVATLSAEQDPREVFADWLIDGKNPWFAAVAVNRIWYWLLGRGIVQEPDDFRPDNPPENPQLLAWLAEELVSAHYDLKHIYRQILTSSTYQLSSIGRSPREDAADHFAQYPLRRLEAEVLADALCQITGSTEKYSSATPEPFTFIPEDMRTISLPDGSITSAFLEMFGRPPRDSGMDRERNNRVNAAQRLHLLNSTHVRQKILQSGKIQALGRVKKTADLVDGLYLLILSRWPTDDERAVIQAYHGQVAVDVAWALINSDEFLYRH